MWLCEVPFRNTNRDFSGKLDTQKFIFSMPPTVISPTLLTGPRYNSDMVLESTETTQSNNHSICSPPLQWFYMPVGQTNDTSLSATSKVVPPVWRPFPTAHSYSYSGNYNPTSPILSSNQDVTFDLCDQFNDLSIDNYKQKPMRIPPVNYLCHLCFKKGHYIRDCPQVSLLHIVNELFFIKRIQTP